MALDWAWTAWFDRHSGAIEALAGLGMLAFTAVLVLVTRRQAKIAERQADIAEKQAEIQQAQHDLQVQQERRSRPRLELGKVNPPRWNRDRTNVELAFQAGNAGGGEIAAHEVVLTFTTPDAKTREFVGLVRRRLGPRSDDSLTLRGGERGIFTSQVSLGDYVPTNDHVMMCIRPFGGEASPAQDLPPVDTWQG